VPGPSSACGPIQIVVVCAAPQTNKLDAGRDKRRDDAGRPTTDFMVSLNQRLVIGDDDLEQGGHFSCNEGYVAVSLAFTCFHSK
jgi:hypothetical protein